MPKRRSHENSPPSWRTLRTRLKSDRYEAEESIQTTPKKNAVGLELIDKLEHIKEALAQDEDSVELEELEKVSQSAKDYILLRDKLRLEVPDPLQFDCKTDLNLGSAAIADAKVMVDESCTTRSMSKKLAEKCGIDEQDFLYRGLKGDERETKCALNIAKHRKSAVIESLVDFQKQIDFKGKVLKHVADKASEGFDHKSKSDSRVHCSKRLRELRGLRRIILKTPRRTKNTDEINPLDDDMILDSYALRIACEATGKSRRRSLGTVPFNRAWLDEED